MAGILSALLHGALVLGLPGSSGRSPRASLAERRSERAPAVVVLAAGSLVGQREPVAPIRIARPREAPRPAHEPELVESARSASPAASPLALASQALAEDAGPRLLQAPSRVDGAPGRLPADPWRGRRDLAAESPWAETQGDSRAVETSPEGEVRSAADPTVDGASLLHRPPLRYPRAARRAGVEGIVALGLEVGVEGRVARAWIARSSGVRLLDRAALENVRRWVFDADAVQPGRRFRQDVTFSLR